MSARYEFTGRRLVQSFSKVFYYVSSNASSMGISDYIRVFADGNDLGKFQPGETIKKKENVSQWEIIPDAPTLSGVVSIGMDEVSSQRIDISGPVINQPAGLQYARAGELFTGTAWRDASAAHYSLVGFFNESATVHMELRSLELHAASQNTQINGLFSSYPVGAGGVTNTALPCVLAGTAAASDLKAITAHHTALPSGAGEWTGEAPHASGPVNFMRTTQIVGARIAVPLTDAPLILQPRTGVYFFSDLMNTRLAVSATVRRLVS